MTAMISASAVHDAWALYRQPVLSRKLSRMNFHPDMLELIKIAAGDDETIRKWSEEIGTDADHLQDAAAFYLQQVMGRPGNDAYGTIGLAADASALDIKNHKRWLLKWLHPDRNPSVWRQSLYRKVTAAAEQIEGKGPAVIPLALSKHHTHAAHGRPKRRNNSRPMPVVSWKQLVLRASRGLLWSAGIALAIFASMSLLPSLQSFDFSELLSVAGRP
jgi:hypothetical protein